METFTLKTAKAVEFIDITAQVQEIIKKNNFVSGLCVVFIPHTTAAITINENADVNVRKDMIKELNKIVPLDDDYTHSEGNSAGHIKSSLLGFSQTVIVESGKLQLGTWQGIYFCEFDGPRARQVWVKTIKDKG